MRTTRLLLAPMAALIILACGGSDALGPSDVAGTYSATTFTLTVTGQAAVDVLAAGGSLTIVLNANGTTTGSLSIPATVPGGPLNESMAGTFTVSGSTVTFTQTADTFVRDMPFTVSGSTLAAARAFGGHTVQLTLTRQ